MNENWNVSGFILEGISGSGKTTILRELLKSDRFINKYYLSSIVLSEHQTQRVLEHKDREEGLTVLDNVSLLDQHVSYIEKLNDNLDQMQWCRTNQINMRIPYILERFHFTHVYQYNHIEWSDVERIDSKLAELNCKVCVLTADSEILKERIFSGRDAAWMNYIKRFGETEDQIIKHFVDQQNMVLEMAKITQMDTLIIDTSNSSIEDCIDCILDFWIPI